MQLVRRGIRDSTKRTYVSAQSQFRQFCECFKLCPLPVSEVTLLLYITSLYQKGLSHATIMVYLAGIRNLQIEAGFGEPNVSCPQVKQALRAVKEWGPQPVKKSPIKLQLLLEMWQLLRGHVHSVMWRAVLALAFFGGLRGAEYAVTQGSLGKHPTIDQISYKSSQGIMIMYFTVKQSKTSAQGMQVPYGCSGHTLCAVCAVKEYLNVRYEQGPVTLGDPLFLYKGRPLAKSQVDAMVKHLVQQLGLPQEEYSSHSLRAGVASSAAEAGFKDWEVQELGGWRSRVYSTYIRDVRLHRALFAKRLIKHAGKHGS